MVVDSEDVEDGVLLDELSPADGVALLSLDEPLELGYELELLELGVELEPVVEDEESLGLVVELVPEPFVASSFRQSSFAVPVIESQRGLAPYELVDESLEDEEGLVVDELELCANAATGKARATAITTVFSFIESPLRGRGLTASPDGSNRCACKVNARARSTLSARNHCE